MSSRERKDLMCGRKLHREAWNELDQDRWKEKRYQEVPRGGEVWISFQVGDSYFDIL